MNTRQQSPRIAPSAVTNPKQPDITQGRNSIPGRWSWHHRVLSELNDRLIRDTNRSLSDAAQPIEPHSMDIADSATDDFDHDRAIAELSAEQNALFEVQSALRRIERGCYGICQDTGRRIPAARLRALPWTRFCKEAAAQLEKRGLIRIAHLNAARSIQGGVGESLEECQTPESEKSPVVLPPGLRSILPS